MSRVSCLQRNNDSLLLVSVALWCVSVLAETNGKPATDIHCATECVRANGHKVSVAAVGTGQLSGLGRDSSSTISWKRVELSGVSRSQLPLFVEDADACHTACDEQRDCVAWMFRSSQLRCHLFTDRLALHECETQDCEAGIRVERAKGVESLIEDVEDIIKVPAERYRGLGLTCKEKSRYTSVSAVLAACGKVLRHCATAAREVDPVPLPSVKCASDEMKTDTNLYGFDFNNGFEEVVLFSEDCCRKCMEAKNCRGWTRTASGQCWLKFDVPDSDNVEMLIGDVAGVRPALKAKCGPHFTGITYVEENPDSKNVTENITDIEHCCQLCVDNHRCSVWSFFPLEQICVQNYYLNGVKTKHPNVTTSFMVTVPEACDNDALIDATSPEDIAAAYNPQCSAILKFGPMKPRPGCQERQDAITFFRESYDRIRRVI